MKKTYSFALAALALSTVLGGCSLNPEYRVYAARKEGEAELAQADGNRQIKVQEAKALFESADYKARAEVREAQGVAQANEIMKSSLGGTEGYLRWKYINMLQESKDKQVIYIPTEAGLPILEAGKRVLDK
jgi:regulator of protease activity HflC (stomatin/prohibitin superfamily)